MFSKKNCYPTQNGTAENKDTERVNKNEHTGAMHRISKQWLVKPYYGLGPMASNVPETKLFREGKVVCYFLRYNTNGKG